MGKVVRARSLRKTVGSQGEEKSRKKSSPKRADHVEANKQHSRGRPVSAVFATEVTAWETPPTATPTTFPTAPRDDGLPAWAPAICRKKLSEQGAGVGEVTSYAFFSVFVSVLKKQTEPIYILLEVVNRLSRTKSGGQHDGSKPMRCDCTPFSFASLRFACVARPRDARAWVKTKQKTPPPEKSILCVVSIVHSRGTAWPEQHQNTSSPFARPPSTSDIPRGPRTSPPVPKTAAAAAAVAASLISAKSMSSSDSRSTAQT